MSPTPTKSRVTATTLVSGGIVTANFALASLACSLSLQGARWPSSVYAGLGILSLLATAALVAALHKFWDEAVGKKDTKA